MYFVYIVFIFTRKYLFCSFKKKIFDFEKEKYINIVFIQTVNTLVVHVVIFQM
jgi:hypothetical protein